MRIYTACVRSVHATSVQRRLNFSGVFNFKGWFVCMFVCVRKCLFVPVSLRFVHKPSWRNINKVITVLTPLFLAVYVQIVSSLVLYVHCTCRVFLAVYVYCTLHRACFGRVCTNCTGCSGWPCLYGLQCTVWFWPCTYNCTCRVFLAVYVYCTLQRSCFGRACTLYNVHCVSGRVRHVHCKGCVLVCTLYRVFLVVYRVFHCTFL